MDILKMAYDKRLFCNAPDYINICVIGDSEQLYIMYGYIFWVIYKRNKLKNKSEWLSRNNASGIVFIALLVHFALIVQLIKAFYGRKTLPGYLKLSNGILIIVFLGINYLAYLYFTKDRIARIQRKYESKGGILLYNSGLIVASLVFVPLLAVVLLGWTG